MEQIDHAEIGRSLFWDPVKRSALTLIGPDSAELQQVPRNWLPIALSPDPHAMPGT
jgi:hypothetical protein